MRQPRGRSRDGASSSSHSKTTRSARSRDRSRGSAVVDGPTSVKKSQSAASKNLLVSTVNVEQRKGTPDNLPNVCGDPTSIESKMSELPATNPAPENSSECRSWGIKPSEPTLSSSQRDLFKNSTIADRVAKRRRIKNVDNPKPHVPSNPITSKRRARSATPSLYTTRRPPQPQKKRHKTSETPLIQANEHKPHCPPSQLPNLDLPAGLRPLRDDLVKQMQLLQNQTLKILGRKIDNLEKQNELLRKKVDNIEARLYTPQQIKTSTPTPTHQLPHFLAPQPAHPSEPQQRDENLPRNDEEYYMSCEDQTVISSPEPCHRVIRQERSARNDANSPSNQRQRKHELHRSQEESHFDWLKKRFTECFGLPTDMYKRRKLMSFDGVEVAKGYNRVVATWQGLFFELRDEDINYDALAPGFNTAQGMSTLTTKGVKLFKLSRADTRTTPKPHRFAVIPSGNPATPCNPLKVGRWYVHVYQTKIELDGFLKTLNSKAIARDLQKKWGIQYMPRSRDIDQVLPQPIPPSDPTIQSVPYPSEPHPSRAPANPNEQRLYNQPVPHRENLHQNNAPFTFQTRLPPTLPVTMAATNATAQPTFPLTSNPPPLLYNSPVNPYALQNPQIHQNRRQYQQPSCQQLVQQLPPVTSQPAQFAQFPVPSYYYAQMNPQPCVQNPYFLPSSLNQQYNVNGNQPPYISRNET